MTNYSPMHCIGKYLIFHLPLESSLIKHYVFPTLVSFIFILTSCTSQTDREVEATLFFAGNNRPELELVDKDLKFVAKLIK